MAYRPPPDKVQFQRIRVAAAVIEAGRVLLVAHQFSNHPRAWLLPGGRVELGETLTEAAAREIREETGLEAEVGRVTHLPGPHRILCRGTARVGTRRTT